MNTDKLRAALAELCHEQGQQSNKVHELWTAMEYCQGVVTRMVRDPEVDVTSDRLSSEIELLRQFKKDLNDAEAKFDTLSRAIEALEAILV